MSRCLLVDDVPSSLLSLVPGLKAAHNDVELVRGSERALTWVEAQRFDVLLLTESCAGEPLFIERVRAADPDVALVVLRDSNGPTPPSRRCGLLAVASRARQADLFDIVSNARRGALVAIVEDDLALADNLSEILAYAGFSTVHARSVAELAGLATLPLKAGIADLRLPDGRDGEGLARLCEQFPSLPVISISALPKPPSQATYEHLLKPLNAARLLVLLEQIVGGDAHALRDAP